MAEMHIQRQVPPPKLPSKIDMPARLMKDSKELCSCSANAGGGVRKPGPLQ